MLIFFVPHFWPFLTFAGSVLTEYHILVSTIIVIQQWNDLTLFCLLPCYHILLMRYVYSHIQFSSHKCPTVYKLAKIAYIFNVHIHKWPQINWLLGTWPNEVIYNISNEKESWIKKNVTICVVPWCTEFCIFDWHVPVTRYKQKMHCFWPLGPLDHKKMTFLNYVTVFFSFFKDNNIP